MSRYYRNPKTGLIERVSNTNTSSDVYTPVGNTANRASYDEMLQSIDDLVANPTQEATASPIQRRPVNSPSSNSPLSNIHPTELSKLSLNSPKINTNPQISPRTHNPFQQAELEQLELNNSRQERHRIQKEKIEADYLESQTVAAERIKDIQSPATANSLESQVGPLGSLYFDESILSRDYINALMKTIKKDTTLAPVPEDFTSPDGFYYWQQTVRMRLQDVLLEILRYKYLEPQKLDSSRDSRPKNLTIKVMIVEARGLIAKEGRTRSPYCRIESGNLLSKSKNSEISQTEVISNTINPKWRQHIFLGASNLDNQVSIEVMDKQKDQFLGRVLLSMYSLVKSLEKDGQISGWYPLSKRDPKFKDKYVGGEIYLDISCEKLLESKRSEQNNPYKNLEGRLFYSRIDMACLYNMTLRCIIVLDMRVLSRSKPISEVTTDILSPESKTILRSLAQTWRLGDSTQIIILMDILFTLYKQDGVPIGSFFEAFAFIKDHLNKDGWILDYEIEKLSKLFVTAFEYFLSQLQKYKEYFPKNKPPQSLELTILIVRMIYKDSLFINVYQPREESFTNYLKKFITEACIARYESFRQLTAPFDENDYESVLESLTKLSEMINDDIESEYKYFKAPFSKEFDILKLSTETYLKYFSLTMEGKINQIASPGNVKQASPQTFALFQKLKEMNTKFMKAATWRKPIDGNWLEVEQWFTPFMNSWLDLLEEKTIEWVGNSIKIDKFDSENSGSSNDRLGFSSSITDVFSAIFQEIKFIKELNWSNQLENAKFLQKFTKIVNKALEQYCDAISLGEATVESTGYRAWMQTLLSKSSVPQDIRIEFCTKLCNIEFSLKRLNEVYIAMDIPKIKALLREAPTDKRLENKSRNFSGSLNIDVKFAEDIRSLSQTFKCNPYIILRVPESKLFNNRNSNNSLTSSAIEVGKGKAELLKSRVISDTLNPIWDENFQVLLANVEKLEIIILSKNSINLFSADDTLCTGSLDLQTGGTLRKKLTGGKPRDIFVDLEPQGRLLLQITSEGEMDDIDFWFRKTRARLKRTRDEFLRMLTSKISPYANDVIIKALKEQEAAPVSSNFFMALSSSVQYHDKTTLGVSINTPITENELDSVLNQLTEYLNINFEILAITLPSVLAQEAVRRIWDELMIILLNALIPQLFGPIEKDRKIFNERQVSLVKLMIDILRDFFHAEGEGIGIPISELENDKFTNVMTILSRISTDLPRLKRECELGIESGRDKEVVLRLIRLFLEKNNKLNAEEKSSHKEWMDEILIKRKEIDRRNIMLLMQHRQLMKFKMFSRAINISNRTRYYSKSKEYLKLWVKFNGNPPIKVSTKGCDNIDDFSNNVRIELNTKWQVALYSSLEQECITPSLSLNKLLKTDFINNSGESPLLVKIIPTQASVIKKTIYIRKTDNKDKFTDGYLKCTIKNDKNLRIFYKYGYGLIHLSDPRSIIRHFENFKDGEKYQFYKLC